MNLGPRCEYMLPNHMQCPNTANEDSEYCELHTEPEADTSTDNWNPEEEKKN